MTPICAKCHHCRKSTDMPGHTPSWLCAAAEPYSRHPAHVHPMTGRRVPEIVRLVPCVWLNDEAQCRLYRHGEPGSTGEEARVQPNYLLWARDKRKATPQTPASEEDTTGDVGLLAIMFLVMAIIVGAVLAS